MFLLVAILSLLTSPSFPQSTILADTVIAETSFRFSRPTVVRMPVQTCNSKGKVKTVQLHVKEGRLNMKSLDAYYTAGGRQRLASTLRLEKDKFSGWFILGNQENPCLTRLEMNVSNSSVKTTVEVIGRWEQ
jgi:hypothetical protein